MIAGAIIAASLLMLCINVSPATASNTAYYVDCSAGSNGDGSSSNPWNGLTNVNSKPGGFSSGDQILLKRGTTCSGQLAPSGSGSNGSPITVDAWGTGSDPVVAGNGASSAISLTNQSYWTLQNLTVTNSAASEGDRDGIVVRVTDSSVHAGITLQNLTVKDVSCTSDASSSARWSNAGIFVIIPGSGTGSLDGVLIQNNDVNNVRCVGIYTAGTAADTGAAQITNLVIRHNTTSRTGTDGIIVGQADGPLAEYNTVSEAGYASNSNNAWVGLWTYNSNNPLIQFNEVAYTYSSNDGYAYDCDWGTTGTCTYQYNYSHDNAGGVYLQCVGCRGGTDSSPNLVFRYNISQHDYQSKFRDGYGSVASFRIYNNVFYNPTEPASFTVPGSVTVTQNNIFVGASGGSFTSSSYDYNTFYGFTGPSDAHKSNADPAFSSPGTGGTGIDTVSGYRLQTSSPALSSGILISGNGGRDYFNNAVLSGSAPNRGAYNGSGVSGGGTLTAGTYKIVNQNSSKALGISGSSTSNSARANQYDYVAADSQKWSFQDAGGGYYYIVNVNSGKVLGIDSQSTANDATVTQYTNTGVDAEKWAVSALGSGVYQFQNKNSSKVLGVRDSSYANDAYINQYDNYSVGSQEWSVTAP